MKSIKYKVLSMKYREKIPEIQNTKYQILNTGFTLIEILIVITIFAVLGIIVTESIILSLQGSKKSEGLVAVRENLDYSTGIMERQLRNANSIDGCGAEQPSTTAISYYDQDGKLASFSCLDSGTTNNNGTRDVYIASGSGNLRLTSNSVAITSCSIICTESINNNPPYVDINISAKSAILSAQQQSAVTTSVRVYLRNY